MSECRRTAERLTPYVDECLPAAEREQVERHLAACPPCRLAATEERAGRQVLRERCAGFRAAQLPPGLRTRCEALARAHCTSSTGGWAREWGGSWVARILPVGLATLLIVFTGTAIMSLATHRSNVLLAAQLTADHMRCFRQLPANAVSADAQQLETMLQTRYGWDVRVPPSSNPDGLRLVSAKRCRYVEGPIPHVMYQVDGENVSLFILEGVERDPGDLVSLGYRTRIWSRGTNTYVLVTPQSAGDLSPVTRYIREQAH